MPPQLDSILNHTVHWFLKRLYTLGATRTLERRRQTVGSETIFVSEPIGCRRCVSLFLFVLVLEVLLTQGRDAPQLDSILNHTVHWFLIRLSTLGATRTLPSVSIIT